MARSFRIDVFSSDVFRSLWYKSNILSYVLPRPKMHEGIWMPQCFVDAVAEISIYRRVLFQQFFPKNMQLKSETYSQSNIDFYIFLKENVSGILPNKDMVIFDKVFMALALANEMCHWCSRLGAYQFIYFAPMAWELYFQTEIMEQLWDSGEWSVFVSYVLQYKQSKLFSLADQMQIKWFTNNYVGVVEIFNKAIEDYDKLELVEYFKQKLESEKYEGTKVCLQCSPIYAVLSTFAYGSESSPLSPILIEGYIQILLQMFFDVNLTTTRITMLNSLKENIPEMFNTDISEDENSSSALTEEKNIRERNMIENDLDEIVDCKKHATKVLIENLFEEFYMECDDSDCSLESDHINVAVNTCIFCAKEVFQRLEPTETLWEELLLIKSVIWDALKSTETDKIQFIQEKTLHINNPLLVKKNYHEEKFVLRMFFALGVEPVKSSVIEALKNETLNIVTEDFKNLNLKQNTKSNRKKSKNKKLNQT